MSVASRPITVLGETTLSDTTGFPIDVSGFADWTLQQVQTVTAGGGTAAVYGSALPFGDPRLADTDPSTNPHWELDAGATWAAPGAEGARAAGKADNRWATILAHITIVTPLEGFAIYFFGKER
jgi:hypothetical protein